LGAPESPRAPQGLQPGQDWEWQINGQPAQGVEGDATKLAIPRENPDRFVVTINTWIGVPGMTTDLTNNGW